MSNFKLLFVAVCSDAMETVIHSADAFAPVGYLRFTQMHTEDKGQVGLAQLPSHLDTTTVLISSSLFLLSLLFVTSFSLFSHLLFFPLLFCEYCSSPSFPSLLFSSPLSALLWLFLSSHPPLLSSYGLPRFPTSPLLSSALYPFILGCLRLGFFVPALPR